ncbi:endonuclease/exonuclease/phosphatase family protein [Bifidobacterium eulemuris]|uniref:Endonuclease n=1 Tax=Bifidobacterium eulemuris TaxID=1765219 RepID=A0A261G5L5_9BIFI|nr:endonuclease/exonuclease/phosphatase family protein [Bifidobacterium eulemuris]OZG66495.1 endonuclease [Bifidobacterium eulemuris]QOL32591.1 endonuclease/exonuclease/phosphatase family protein [Bifidobacterium eulemuris]
MTVLFFVLWIIAALWIALTALPAGWEGHMPMPYLIALVPFLWIPLVALAVWAAVLHEWGIVGAMLVLALAASSRRMQYLGSGFDMSPSAVRPIGGTGRASTTAKSRETSRETLFGSRETDRETSTAANTDGPERSSGTTAASPIAPNEPFSVMTLNCRFGRADAAHIVREVRERNITVLALQELTGELVAALDEEGLAELLPYHQLGEERDTDNGGFNGIWTAYEPASATSNAVDIPAADVPAVTIPLSRDEDETPAVDTDDTDGIEPADESEPDVAPARRYITFASAHPKSPMRGCPQWSAGIRGLGALADAAKSGGDIAVVMGDLNSGTDHPSFRALLKSGFTDASLAYAHGPNLTFPSWLPWPRIELDHVLVTRGLKVSHVESFIITTTDHLAVTATLVVR